MILTDDGDQVCESPDNTVSLKSRRSRSPVVSAGPEPGDVAAAFTVPTLDGEFSYQPGALRGPVVIHAFTNKSGFLECLWSSESSLSSLVQDLPDSTQVLFLSLDDSAVSDALWMREQLQRAAMHRWPSCCKVFLILKYERNLTVQYSMLNRVLLQVVIILHNNIYNA